MESPVDDFWSHLRVVRYPDRCDKHILNVPPPKQVLNHDNQDHQAMSVDMGQQVTVALKLMKASARQFKSSTWATTGALNCKLVL